MAGSRNPGYNSDMQSVAVPDYDAPGEQPMPNIDWAPPPPGQPDPLVDLLTGDTVAPGEAFVRVVSVNGNTDVPDPGV